MSPRRAVKSRSSQQYKTYSLHVLANSTLISQPNSIIIETVYSLYNNLFKEFFNHRKPSNIFSYFWQTKPIKALCCFLTISSRNTYSTIKRFLKALNCSFGRQLYNEFHRQSLFHIRLCSTTMDQWRSILPNRRVDQTISHLNVLNFVRSTKALNWSLYTQWKTYLLITFWILTLYRLQI